ncbi:unnamed protein product [Fusarium graminearum]|nr:unnamed protein product [Fusarium graminearum]
MGREDIRIVDEDIKTTSSQFGDLVFASFNALWVCDFEREAAHARALEILDHVGVSHRRNDMAAF